MAFGLGFAGGFAHAASGAQTDHAEQQIRLLEVMRDLQDDPIRRSLMLQQLATGSKQILKNPDDTYSIIDLANPSNPAVHIGSTRDYKTELQALKKGGQLPAGLSSGVDAALSSGDPQMQRDIYESAIKLMGSPTYAKANLSPAEKAEALSEYLASGSLPPMAVRAVQQALAGNNPAMIESVYNKVIPPVFGAGAYATHVLQQSNIDPNTGLPVTTPYVMPARGGTAKPIRAGGSIGTSSTDSGTAMPAFTAPGAVSSPPSPFGGGTLRSVKVGGQESKLIGQVQSLLPQLESLKQDIEALGPERWNQARLKYPMIKYLGVSPTGDDAEKTIQKAIQTEASAKAALAATSGTRAIGYMKMSEGHIPSGGSDYNYNINAINNLLSPNGPYKSVLRLYGVNPAAPVAESADAGPDLPPASMVPLNTKRSFSNGKTYQNIGGSISEVTP